MMKLDQHIEPSVIEGIRSILERTIQLSIVSLNAQATSGGSINACYQLIVNNRLNFFCKLNDATTYPGLFEKEQLGLKQIQEQNIFRTPAIIACEDLASTQLLILEWIEPGTITNKFWKSFGTKLAALHKLRQDNFGLHYDNYMGAIPQHNSPNPSWIEFFIHQRLMPLVQSGFDRQLLEKTDLDQFDRLYKRMDKIFEPHPPALLHGDLWSGNFLVDQSGEPVLIDPAVYFGHPSMDLAMTTLFGGFDPIFYEAYRYISPFPFNHQEQWRICNLYPLLIHLHLFGSGYLGAIRRNIQSY